LEEVLEAAKAQKNHKSAGPDGIPPEVLKCSSVQQALLAVLNGALKSSGNLIPDDFFEAYLVALHKKGSIEDPANYRGVSLMSTVAKLFHLIIMRRIRRALDPWISPTQNAYRPSRSCQQHIVAASAMHQLASNHKDYELHMLFVDFSKAFDSVDRTAIEQCLKWWNIPGELVAVIMKMLEEHKLRIRYGGDVSENPICPTMGILQGDTLAPLIFILCMDMILLKLDPSLGAVVENFGDTDYLGWKIPRGTASRPGVPIKRLSNLAYSDDVVLLANSTRAIQQQFDIFQTAAAQLGMSINLGAGKTEEIRINAPDGDPLVQTHAGETVQIVEEYKYLGMCLGQGWFPDFQRRRKLAWAIVREYSYIWHSDASMDAKYNLFQALVEPLLIYGAITYPRTADVTTALHGTHARMLRHCLGLRRANVKSADHVTTEFLYAGVDRHKGKSLRACCLTLPAAVDRQRLAALGHWTRDHFGYSGHSFRRHPVIDVLRFEPKGFTRRPSAKQGLQDAFNASLPHQLGRDKFTVKRNILISQDSLAADRHGWYDMCRESVWDFDTALLTSVMRRRMNDASRNFTQVEYETARMRLGNDEVYRERWLTNRTREHPLGCDRRYIDPDNI
jgi:hypothetical protein